MKEEGEKLPEPWPSSGQRKITQSGEEIELRIRLVALDPLDQVATRQMQAILWRGGHMVQQEEHTLLERLYFRNELLAMLAAAGFRDVEVWDGYTGNRASAHSGILSTLPERNRVSEVNSHLGGRPTDSVSRCAAASFTLVVANLHHRHAGLTST